MIQCELPNKTASRDARFRFGVTAPRCGVVGSRAGISLIETVACVAIVAAMSTAIVGVMQTSARVAAASRTSVGAPAKARQALRELSDRIQAWDRADGISFANGSTIRSGARTYRFSTRSSTTGEGRDLILQDDLGTETVCVLGDLVGFELTPMPDRNFPDGVELRLRLQIEGDEATQLRPGQLEADIRTRVCFPPQLRVKS